MRRFLRLAALILSFSSLVRTRRRGGTGRERLGGFTLVGFPFGPAFFALEGFAFLVPCGARRRGDTPFGF